MSRTSQLRPEPDWPDLQRDFEARFPDPNHRLLLPLTPRGDVVDSDLDVVVVGLNPGDSDSAHLSTVRGAETLLGKIGARSGAFINLLSRRSSDQSRVPYPRTHTALNTEAWLRALRAASLVVCAWGRRVDPSLMKDFHAARSAFADVLGSVEGLRVVSVGPYAYHPSRYFSCRVLPRTTSKEVIACLMPFDPASLRDIVQTSGTVSVDVHA